MGLFGSRPTLDGLRSDCAKVTEHSTRIRDLCDKSLRGKFEYMPPEGRADLLREANQLAAKLRANAEAAYEIQRGLEAGESSSEELITAQSLVVEAKVDAESAQSAVVQARESLVSGMAEIEDFYGKRSKEARHIRKVLGEFQASA